MSYLPDKPLSESRYTRMYIEYVEETELWILQRAAGIVLLSLITIALGATVYFYLIGLLVFQKVVFYIFVPIILILPLEGVGAQILLTIELLVIFTSVYFVATNEKGGIIAEYHGKTRSLVSYSESFFIGYFLSIIIVLLINVGNGGGFDFIDLYHISLSAPFCEEISFRLLWLLLPVALYTITMGQNLDDNFEQKDLLNIILKGKGKLNKLDYYLLGFSSVFFGFVHWVIYGINLRNMEIVFEYGWAPGKIIQASLIGFFMGYFALKYGLPFSIVFHWLVNTLGAVNMLLFMTNNLIVLVFYSLLMLLIIGLGLVFLIVAAYRFIKG